MNDVWRTLGMGDIFIVSEKMCHYLCYNISLVINNWGSDSQAQGFSTLYVGYCAINSWYSLCDMNKTVCIDVIIY